MTEYKEKGSVEKPILSEEAARERTQSERSLDAVEIVDTIGDQQLLVNNDVVMTSLDNIYIYMYVCMYVCMYMYILYITYCNLMYMLFCRISFVILKSQRKKRRKKMWN